MNCLLLLVLLVTLMFPVINGGHFLGGTITWKPVDAANTGSPVAIAITQTYIWRWTAGPCNASDIANNRLIPFVTLFIGMFNYLNCVLNCASATGYVAPRTWPYCIDASPILNTSVGQRTDIVNVTMNADFTVTFEGAIWRPLATNPSANWSLALRIIMAQRPDNGRYNNAPVATVISPRYIIQNVLTVIHIPVADADGDTLRCRWSVNYTECGDVCPPSSLPNGATIFPNCTITMTGTVVGDWFAVTIMVEDFISPTSITPLSSVPVQFLVCVVDPPACSTSPDVYELSHQSCIIIQPGQTYSSQLIGINNCGASVTIVDIVTMSVVGVNQSDLIQANSTTYYKTFSWTPTISQIGYQVICAAAIDSQYIQSSQYCFTFYVTVNPNNGCPMAPVIAVTTTTANIRPTGIDWPLIAAIIGLVALGMCILCNFCLLCCCAPCIGGIDRDFWLWQLYHIERCTDPYCQQNFNVERNRWSRLFYSPTTSSSSVTIDHDNKFNTKRFDHVSVTRVKPPSVGRPLITPNIHSPNRMLQGYIDLPSEQSTRTHATPVPRLNSSSTTRTLYLMNNEAKQNLESDDIYESDSDAGVTPVHSLRPIKVYKISHHTPSPPPIEDTIESDDNSELSPSVFSSAKFANDAPVRRIQSPYQLVKFRRRLSQRRIIRIIPETSIQQRKPPPFIRIRRVYRKSKKIVSTNKVVPLTTRRAPPADDKKQ